MTIFRYKSACVALLDLQKQVPGKPRVVASGPCIFVDIDAPDTSKDDLDEYMASRGFTPDKASPIDTPAEEATKALLATPTAAGFMSAADKAKLDKL